MKNIIYIIIVVALIAVGVTVYKGNEQKKTDGDYEKITMVQNAMEKLSKTSAIRSFDNQAQWYVFDVRVAYQNDSEFYNALKKELGEDFDSRLSNGDYLFAGILPTYQKIKIFAGNPETDDNMIYPDWNYSKLEAR